MQVTGAAVFVPALAAIAVAASAGGGTGGGPGATPDASGQGGPAARHRATLMPVSSDPFKVRGTGVRACGGVEGVAAGSRGSHASFQYSSFTC